MLARQQLAVTKSRWISKVQRAEQDVIKLLFDAERAKRVMGCSYFMELGLKLRNLGEAGEEIFERSRGLNSSKKTAQEILFFLKHLALMNSKLRKQAEQGWGFPLKSWPEYKFPEGQLEAPSDLERFLRKGEELNAWGEKERREGGKGNPERTGG